MGPTEHLWTSGPERPARVWSPGVTPSAAFLGIVASANTVDVAAAGFATLALPHPSAWRIRCGTARLTCPNRPVPRFPNVL